MNKLTAPLTALAFSLAAGCGSGSTDADTATTGEARFADADTNADGSDREPARPESTFSVSVEIAGTGDLSGLDTTCLDGASGMFEGLLGGTAEVDDGIYVAALAAGSAGFTTPSGCDIPDLEISALTEVVIRAELTATTTSCESYCAARARQSAEAECDGDGDQVACRGTAEGEYTASCEVACEQSEHRIVAETALSAAARTELAASQVTGSSLGTIEADLTFDRVEDASGQVIDER